MLLYQRTPPMSDVNANANAKANAKAAGYTTSKINKNSKVKSKIKSNKLSAHDKSFLNRMYDDESKCIPEQVEELLTKELFELSLKNRNDFQDEIHGVCCIAPEETPELLRSSLAQMAYHLDNNEHSNAIPLDQKRAYLRTKTLDKTTYTHEDDFRLRFLRCELFDVSKAAVRMALFLNMLVDLFGSYALERPIRLNDFSKTELCEFRKGHLQLLSCRDRGGMGTGRQIFCLFPDKEYANIPPKVRHKIALYQIYMAGNDVDTQRKGLVVLIWFDANSEPSWKPAHYHTKVSHLPTVRISGLHICSPDTPFHRVRRAIGIMMSGHLRSSMRVHVGEGMKLWYILQGFGIPIDKIPITYSGAIKTATLRNWMMLRHLEEDEHLQKMMAINSCKSNSNVKMIDSPYLTDILLRKGKSLASHPGNATMRRLIKSKVESRACDNENYKTRQFVYEIIEEMKQQQSIRNGGVRSTNAAVVVGDNAIANKNNLNTNNNERHAAHRTNSNNPPIRFLEWDDAIGNCWREINDKKTIYNKIRRIVNEYQSIARGGKSTQRKTPTMINQRGGTSIFQYQDGSLGPSTKKPRLNKDGNLDEADSMSCFGKNFMAC